MTIVERALELVPNDADRPRFRPRRPGLRQGPRRTYPERDSARPRRPDLGGDGGPGQGGRHSAADPGGGGDPGPDRDRGRRGGPEPGPDQGLRPGWSARRVVAASSRRLVILVGEESWSRAGNARQVAGRGDAIRPAPVRAAAGRTRLPAGALRPGGRSVCDGQRQSHSIVGSSRLRMRRVLEMDIRAIPGVVGTGLFLGMADTVLVGDRRDFRMLEERHREDRSHGTRQKPTTSRCNKLHELPPVVTDWQRTVWCPDCDSYDCGLCGNPYAGTAKRPVRSTARYCP